MADEQRNSSQKSNVKNTVPWTQTWKMTALKIAFTGASLFAFYGIYLDGQIRSKMDGQVWRLPAEVYSRIQSVRLADKLSLEQIKQGII